MLTYRIMVLIWATRTAWPEYSARAVADVVGEAIAAETDAVPAELLIVIARHESDFERGAVSWRRRDGKRVDLVWTERSRRPPDRPLTCGFVQAMARDRADCARIIADAGGMTTGVRELAEWSRLCKGDMGCMARGHAGGSRCAKRRSACSRAARRISDHFVEMTNKLRGP